MRRNIFINREFELNHLQTLWDSKKFALVIVYGRRRIGKTRLLMEFSRNKRTIYYLAVESSYEIMCREFSEIVRKILGIPVSGDIIELLDVLATMAKEKILVIFDEFQYIVDADPSFTSRLQRLIDLKLKESNMMIILCGSAVSFFEKKLLGYRSPLFGRRESSIKLRPLKFKHIKYFFSRYSILDLIRIYGIIGGTPAYIMKLNPHVSIRENIRKIITPGNYLYDEAVNILRQEVREPRTYFNILLAISEGKDSPSEVAQIAHVDARSINKYISLLEELDIIKRIRPLGFKRPVKLRFVDNYFRFWFTYVYKLRSLLESGYIDDALEYIMESLDYYTSKVFEDLVEELVPELFKAGIIKTRPIQIGKWWHKNLEIDVIVREPGKSSTFIEAKWRKLDKKKVKEILDKLEDTASKTGLQSPRNYYLLIAKEIENGKIIINEHKIAIDLSVLSKII